MSADIPAAVSLPHFYQADESLLERIDGLKPNKTLHGTTLAIQPVSIEPIHEGALRVRVSGERLQTPDLALPQLRLSSDLAVCRALRAPGEVDRRTLAVAKATQGDNPQTRTSFHTV